MKELAYPREPWRPFIGLIGWHRDFNRLNRWFGGYLASRRVWEFGLFFKDYGMEAS